MSSRVVKWLILASILLMAFPVLAGASTSRLAGMGVQGDYVKDYTNIFTYVSNLCCVGNLVYGELGVATDYDENWSEYYNTEDRAVGAVLGNLFDGRFGTIGFHMREYSPALGTGSQPYVGYNGYLDEYILGTGFETFWPWGVDPNIPGDTGYTPYWNYYGVEAFDLMWGKKFGTMSLGLRFNRSNYKEEWKYEDTGSESEATYEGYEPYDRNVMGFGAGLGFEMSPTLATELSVLYQSRTFNWEYSDGDVYESDGGGSYLVAGRMLWQWQPDVMVVPVMRYYSFDMSEKYTPDGGTADEYETKYSGWQVGVAGNWSLNANDLFVAGLSFAQNKYEYGYDEYADEYTESLMPVMFASLETRVNPWLTLRFGGRKGVLYSIKEEYGDDTYTYEWKDSWSPFQFFLGAGVKLGTLQLDGVLAQDFFHNPASYLDHSENYYSPLFPKVTATYTF